MDIPISTERIAIKAGQPAIEAIKCLKEANLAIMLEGDHGIGKSALFDQAAGEMGIDVLSRDLSLMEPADLAGIPYIQEGRTVYAFPNSLPTQGEGLLVFEELNDAPRYMQTCCMTLLTQRTLNDYVLPKGWLPVCSINPAENGYDRHVLCPALKSRFVIIRLIPDEKLWLDWANKNNVHKLICLFVELNPGIMEDRGCNPRALTYASQFLTSYQQMEKTIWKKLDDTTLDTLLKAGLHGILPKKWAMSLFALIKNQPKNLLSPKEILQFYPKHRPEVLDWVATAQMDLITATLKRIERFISDDNSVFEDINNKNYKKNLEAFLNDIPGDLIRPNEEWLVENKFINAVDCFV